MFKWLIAKILNKSKKKPPVRNYGDNNSDIELASIALPQHAMISPLSIDLNIALPSIEFKLNNVLPIIVYKTPPDAQKKFVLPKVAPTNIMNMERHFLSTTNRLFFQKQIVVHKNTIRTQSSYDDDLKLITDNELALCFNKSLEKYRTINSYPILGNAILWEAKKPGFPSIYVLNTTHTLKKINPKDHINFKHIISNVDIVYTEVNFLNDYKRTKYLKKLADKKIKYYFDFMLAHQASKMGKMLKNLENEKIIKLSGLLRLSELIRLQDTVENKCNSKCIMNLFYSLDKLEFDAQYATHVTPSFLSKKSICPVDQANKAHTEGRNKFWMSRIITDANKSLLVACGAVHSVGECGLPALLHHEGYQIQAAIKKMPLSSKTILRRMFRSSYLFSPPLEKEKEQKQELPIRQCTIL